MDYGIHWFRRDLRVAGNEALRYNFKKTKGKTLGIFVFDHSFLNRPDFSNDRFAFFLKTMKALKEELKALGGDLLVLDVGPEKAFPKLFKAVKQKPSLITFSIDYEPFARRRDETMSEYFKAEAIEVNSFRDHLVLEPHEVFKKKPGDYYQVYTPFSKKWNEALRTESVSKRIACQKTAFAYLNKKDHDKIFSLKWKSLWQKAPLKDHLDEYLKESLEKASVPIPEAGSQAAYKVLKRFKENLFFYQTRRDFPFKNIGSGLSMYLKNGSLTTAQIIYFLKLKPYLGKKSSEDVFLSELIWREFYYHIIFHRPDVEKDSFNPKYKNLKWENSKEKFDAWKEGKTGFPIVDAGMRELKTTGKMHNRLRMIVASFLTKDLHIDWRWGERYFMEKLLDGDLAPNNGGWQWAASTGCDAQPYFRIFNPWSQSVKFDKEGDYIRKFVPELKDTPSKLLHEPIYNHDTYPEPIVEHSQARLVALEMYKELK